MLVVLAGTKGWAEVGVESKLPGRSGGSEESEKFDVGPINTPSGLSPLCCGAGVCIIGRASVGMILAEGVTDFSGVAVLGGNAVPGPRRMPKGR